MPLIPDQRHLFDLPADVAYINCAYLSPLMKAVEEAGVAGIRRKVQPWTMTRADFFDDVERARAGFARLIGAKADDVAVIPSSSYGAATAAANLPLARGQSVVVIEAEHGSNVRIWALKAREADARIVTVARPADGRWTPRILEAIDKTTAIVAVPPLHWTDGTRVDLVAVGRRTREVGGALVVDATQSIGAEPFELAAIKPDFVMCSAYKWLLSPYTLGFLYAAPQHQAGRPLEEHAFNRAGAREADGRTDYPEAFDAGARRYDMGERSNFISLPMSVRAMDQLASWGPANIAETIGSLTDDLVARAELHDISAPARDVRSPHIVGLSRRGRPWPTDAGQRLAAQKIYVSRRGDVLRISPHLYNCIEENARLVAALAAMP